MNENPQAFQDIKKLGVKLPIIAIPDFTNEMGWSIKLSWDPLKMEVYVMLKTV